MPPFEIEILQIAFPYIYIVKYKDFLIFLNRNLLVGKKILKIMEMFEKRPSSGKNFRLSFVVLQHNT